MLTVDGAWSEWSHWSTCTVSCDTGTRDRTRVCSEPQYGGDTCSGLSEMVEACSIDACPGV